MQYCVCELARAALRRFARTCNCNRLSSLLSLGPPELQGRVKSSERRGVARGVASENRQAKPGASANAAPSGSPCHCCRARRFPERKSRHKLPCQHLRQYRQRETREGQPERPNKCHNTCAARATRATRRPSRPRRRCLCRPSLTMGACGARRSRTATCYRHSIHLTGGAATN